MRLRNLALAAAAAMALAAGRPARAADLCDRACLQGFVDRYIEAMTAHDPTRLPLGSGVRFTENGQELMLGDGLWGTASGRGRYSLYVSDPEAGQAGFLGTVMENGEPVLLGLRLKISDQTITQVETIVARSQNSGSTLPSAGRSLEAKGQPRPQFLRTVPEGERMSREDLVRVADSYFTGLAANTGRNTAPFAPTCNRWENGSQTTNNPSLRANQGVNILAMGCEQQQKSGFFPFVTSIRNRRYEVVDRERGLVLAFGFFEHQGRIKELHLTTGETVPSPVRAPMTFEIGELFQIDRGRIDQVEAVLNTVPYGMISAVWDKRGQ